MVNHSQPSCFSQLSELTPVFPNKCPDENPNASNTGAFASTPYLHKDPGPVSLRRVAMYHLPLPVSSKKVPKGSSRGSGCPFPTAVLRGLNGAEGIQEAIHYGAGTDVLKNK